MPSKKSPKKTSGDGRKRGGKNKKGKKQQRKPEVPLNLYVCSHCHLELVPGQVHRLESSGQVHQDVIITHTCICLPDCVIHNVYDIFPMPLAYLMEFRVEDIHQTGDGGWYWEARLPRWPVQHHHPALNEMRAELEHCHDLGDFDRLRGDGGYGGDAVPVPSE